MDWGGEGTGLDWAVLPTKPPRSVPGSCKAGVTARYVVVAHTPAVPGGFPSCETHAVPGPGSHGPPWTPQRTTAWPAFLKHTCTFPAPFPTASRHEARHPRGRPGGGARGGHGPTATLGTRHSAGHLLEAISVHKMNSFLLKYIVHSFVHPFICWFTQQL